VYRQSSWLEHWENTQILLQSKKDVPAARSRAHNVGGRQHALLQTEMSCLDVDEVNELVTAIQRWMQDFVSKIGCSITTLHGHCDHGTTRDAAIEDKGQCSTSGVQTIT